MSQRELEYIKYNLYNYNVNRNNMSLNIEDIIIIIIKLI